MSLQYKYISTSEEDTATLAQGLAALSKPGTVIVLDGDLGAGKTHFSKAFAAAAGVTEVVNSPTFVLIREYEAALWPLYHMDVYRLSVEEADELGIEDYFYGNGVVLIEWGKRIQELLPERRLDIYIERQDGMQRILHVTPKGEPYKQWCEQIPTLTLAASTANEDMTKKGGS